MNQYPFLFPVKEYFEGMLSLLRLPRARVNKLTDIIDVRYRNNNYGINWLLFSREDDLLKLDLDRVPNYVNIREGDEVLVAGVSFKRHTTEELYPDSDYILNQLKPHKKLVIGGFHQWDCVDKIARRSYERGIETFVDEDTTELFFPGE
ncbi:MAG: hypothetical protein AABY07_08440, partial [Nanoarchaeota archaeon]